MALTILGTTGLALAEVHTSNILLGSLLFLRGVGLSMVSMPALTGALVGLERENVPNAVPLMNVLNRVGGALGTAIVTAVYAAGKTNLDGPAAALAGFSRANWTLVAVVVLSLVPAIALAIMEFRRTRRQTQG
jgi:hypothetical protein